MPDKLMTILANFTGGTSYKAHKYGLDNAERPFIDYGEDSIIWKRTAETEKKNKKYIPLKDLGLKLADRGEQLLTYFLDGSRRVFKVDEIAYDLSGKPNWKKGVKQQKDGGIKRRVIYPVVAGQIGVGCCKRIDKKM